MGGPFGLVEETCDQFSNIGKADKGPLGDPSNISPFGRVFSKPQQLIDKLRGCLNPSTASMMIFLKSNLKWFEELEEDVEED